MVQAMISGGESPDGTHEPTDAQVPSLQCRSKVPAQLPGMAAVHAPSRQRTHPSPEGSWTQTSVEVLTLGAQTPPPHANVVVVVSVAPPDEQLRPVPSHSPRTVVVSPQVVPPVSRAQPFGVTVAMHAPSVQAYVVISWVPDSSQTSS
jgi:hypothetical protein